MIVLVIALVVVVAGLAVAAFLGVFGGHLAEPVHTSPFESLPEHRAVRGSDLDKLEFDQTLRGYRMGQVDAVLDRLRREIDERDEIIAEFEQQRHDEAGQVLHGDRTDHRA